MRKAAKQLLICAAALILLCVASRFAFFNGLSLYVPAAYFTGNEGQAAGAAAQSSDPAVLETGEILPHGDTVEIQILPVRSGTADVTVLNAAGEQVSFHVLKVDGFLSVYDYSSGNYTGDTAVLFGVTLFWLLTSAVMVWHFLQARGSRFYDYSTIYYAGFSLFALSSGLGMLLAAAGRLIRPETFSMYSAYRLIGGAAREYMALTAPAMIMFALIMAIANAILLKREGARKQNALGLLVSAALIGGEAMGWILFHRDFMGSEWEYRVQSTLENTYATVFVYFQCMLTGAVICGILAAKRRPAADRDFIIIHGCWFRKDGTLPPLLRSRADAAIAFWKQQKKETGKEASFIPSGGQGPDESMPEAEAIRRYLISRGIEDRLILPETQSRTTLENLRLSREIILKEKPDGKTAFSTSSYHVFRSGLWARTAGLDAEGIGGKTKWWFWPNAFMRETAGLLHKRWKQELLFLILLTGFFALLSLVL